MMNVNLTQLEAELIVAGVAINGLGRAGDDLFTYDEAGVPIDLPAGAAPVLAAHVPAEPPPSEAAGLLEMAGTIDPGGNTAVAELSVVVQAFAAVAAQKGW